MIFAADTEERSLHVFPDAETAAAYCEGLDVEATLWLFWDDDGLPLEPQFTIPNKRGLFTGTSGTYHLVKNASSDSGVLQEALAHIRQVIGETPLNSIRAVQDYLNRHAAGKPRPA